MDTELIQVLKEERDAFAAKLADIGEIIEDSGCDCDCACVGYLSRRFRGRPRLPDGHDDECDEECLGCRIERVLLRGQSRAQCPPPESTILKDSPCRVHGEDEEQ